MLFHDGDETLRSQPLFGGAVPGIGDGLSLEELVLLVGGLRPEAVCRIGRDVARALVRLHALPTSLPSPADGALRASRIQIDVHGNARLLARDGASLDDEPRLMSPERRNTHLPARPVDDLYALGVILIEAALGHPVEVSAGFLDVRVFAGVVPDRLLDALAVLVAPPAQRLTNASAAVRVFESLEPRYGEGGAVLSRGVERARLGAVFGGLGSSLEGDDTEGPITLPDPPEVVPAPAEDVAAPAEGQAQSEPIDSIEAAFFGEEHAPVAALDGGADEARVTAEAPQTALAAGIGVTALALVGVVAGVLSGAFSLPGATRELPVWTNVQAAQPGDSAFAVAPTVGAAQEDAAASVVSVDAQGAESAIAPPSASVAPAVVVPLEPSVPSAQGESDVAPVEPVASAADVAPVEPVAAVAAVAVRPPTVAKEPAVTPALDAQPAPAQAKRAAKPKPRALPAAVSAPEGPPVKLIVEGAAAARARAETALRSCGIDGPILGVLHVSQRKVARVSTEPRNVCVEKVLARHLGGFRGDEPFEIELR